jgi:hypothetical protein
VNRCSDVPPALTIENFDTLSEIPTLATCSFLPFSGRSSSERIAVEWVVSIWRSQQPDTAWPSMTDYVGGVPGMRDQTHELAEESGRKAVTNPAICRFVSGITSCGSCRFDKDELGTLSTMFSTSHLPIPLPPSGAQ